MICRKIKDKIIILRNRSIMYNKARKTKSELGICLYIRNPFFIELGKNVRIKDFYRIECYSQYVGGKYCPRLIIGDNVIINYRFSALVADSLIIGNDTLIASDVLITTENHSMDPETEEAYSCQPLKTGPVIIGNGCWIGEKVTILPNVKIGDKAIIAAGAVVTSDVPAYSICAGVPGRIIKQYDFFNHKWASL